MMNSPSSALPALTPSRPLWRELLDSTLAYLAWGYGVLALSFVGFGFYEFFKWMKAKNPDYLLILLTIAVSLRLTKSFSDVFPGRLELAARRSELAALASAADGGYDGIRILYRVILYWVKRLLSVFTLALFDWSFPGVRTTQARNSQTYKTVD
jgi:hypothetical protein